MSRTRDLWNEKWGAGNTGSPPTSSGSRTRDLLNKKWGVVAMQNETAPANQAISPPRGAPYSFALEALTAGIPLPMAQGMSKAQPKATKAQAVGDGADELRTEVRVRSGGQVLDPLEARRREMVKQAAEKAELQKRQAALSEQWGKLRQANTMDWRSRGMVSADVEANKKEMAGLERQLQENGTGLDRLEYREKYQDATKEDNFFGQFGASYDIGQMGQDQAVAWNDYLNDPTPGKRAYAQSIDQVIQDYSTRNAAALDEDAALPWVSQTLAGYLPQFKGQSIAGLKGAAGGGLTGAVIGSAVPGVGTAAGSAKGLKAGYAAGRAAYTYDTARGIAFSALLDAGVPEATARAAANDEAVVNSIIEAADAGVDILTLGGGMVLKKLLGGGAKAVGGAAGAQTIKKLGKALGLYGINILGEGAQEWVQEGVSIANQDRAQSGGGTGILDLTGWSAGQAGRALSGQDPEGLAQMNAAGREGMKIAAMLGGGQAMTNQLIGRVADGRADTRGQATSLGAVDGDALLQQAAQDMHTPKQTQKTASTGEAAQSLVPYTQHEADNLSTGKRNKVAEFGTSVLSFVQNVLQDRTNTDKLYMGKMPPEISERVRTETGLNVFGYNAVLPGDNIRHIFKKHGDAKTENSHGQIPVTPEDIALIPAVLSAPDSIRLSDATDHRGRTILLFEKKFGGTYVTAQAVSDGRQTLTTDTLYIKKEKNPLVTEYYDADISASPAHNARSVPPQGSSPIPILPQDGIDVNAQSAQTAAQQEATSHTRAEAERLAATLGENGSAAFATAYDQGVAEGVKLKAVFDGFQQVYNSTLKGEPMTETGTKKAAVLPSNILLAAQKAGHADALRAEQARYFGANSGLVRDQYARRANLSTKTARALDAVGKALGVEVRFVERIVVGEGEANARYQDGVITIALNTEDPVLTAFTHEIVHRIREVSPESYRALAEFVQTHMSSEGTARNLDVRQGLYQTQDKSFLTEEMVADAFGRMLGDSKALELFARENQTVAERVRDAVLDLLGTVRRVLSGGKVKLTQEQRAAFQELRASLGEMEQTLEAALKQAATTVQAQTAQKNTAQESGEVKYSIRHDVNNTPYVVVDRDILAGVPRNQWIDTVNQTLTQKFPNGVQVGGNIIKINSKTRREMTFSEYSQWLSRNDKGVYADKFRVAGHADEVILASRGYINEGLKHPRKDNIRDFARGSVLLRLDNADYSAEVVVGTTRSGVMLLYDVLNLQKTTIKERSKHTVQPNQMERRRSGTLASNYSISQNSGDGNTDFSPKGSGEVKYSLNPNFGKQFDEWFNDRDSSGKLKTGGYLRVGTTSEALQSIGVDDYAIFWDKSKIASIINKHQEMTADVIKQVPQIMEFPVLVMQSQTVANRITLYGAVTATDGKPVMVAMELRPQNKRGEIMDFVKVASAYGRDTVQRDINHSDILYLDPNKKRTNTWLEALRLQLPAGLTEYGSIHSITFVNRDVNGNISFGEAGGKTAMQQAFEDAMAQKNTTSNTDGPRFSLKPYSQKRLDDWSHNRDIVVYRDPAQLRQFIQRAADGHGLDKQLYLGLVPADLAGRIQADTGVNTRGRNCILPSSEVHKRMGALNGQKSGVTQGQVARTVADFASIPEVLQSPDQIRLSEQAAQGPLALEFVKTMGGQTTVVTAHLSGRRLELTAESTPLDAKTSIEEHISRAVAEDFLTKQWGYAVTLEDLAEKQGRALLRHEKEIRAANGPRYSLKPYSEKQLKEWGSNDVVVVYEERADLCRFARAARGDKEVKGAKGGNNLNKRLYLGTIMADLAGRIRASTEIDVEGLNCVLLASEAGRALKEYGGNQMGAPHGQYGIEASDFMSIPQMVELPDEIRLAEKGTDGRQGIEFVIHYNDRMTVIGYVSGKDLELTVRPTPPESRTAGLAHAGTEAEFQRRARSIGAAGYVKTLAAYNDMRYNNPTDHALLMQYERGVERGKISPLSTFENYRQLHGRIERELVGKIAANGLLVRGQTIHFMERVLGTMQDPEKAVSRSGVEIQDIIDAVLRSEEIGPIKAQSDGRRGMSFYGKRCKVAFNPDTGVLIQTNPKKEE